jgi:hypothetical protein
LRDRWPHGSDAVFDWSDAYAVRLAGQRARQRDAQRQAGAQDDDASH